MSMDGVNAFRETFECGGGEGPLAGMRVALKDNLCTREGLTTAGSRMLESYRSPFDATAAARLMSAGATIVGKTNMDEFGMGSSCEHCFFGPVRNPWDPERVPGGSSGGSAAAVAAGLADAALGSDTGGSIRQPASHCGVVGLKPTYGRVSRYGLIAYASSLDCVGPIGRTVSDCARLLEAISGPDRHDATCADLPPPSVLAGLEEPVAGLKVGVVRGMMNAHNHPAVNEAMESAAARLAGAGAEIYDIDLPHNAYAVAAYYLVAPSEASSNLARYDGVRFGRRAAVDEHASLEEMYTRTRTEGFGPEVRRRIMLGTHALSSGYYDAYYLRALRVRRLIARDYERAFGGGVSAILMPSSPGPAFKLGEKLTDPMALYLEDEYTVGPSLAGLPAVSVPAGFTDDIRPLPIGVQLVGRPFDEAVLLRVARMLERAWPERASRRPVVWSSSATPSES